MKSADLLKVVESGKIVCVGTYWNGKVEAISMRANVAGGPRRVGHVIHETVLGESEPMVGTRFLRDDEPSETWKPSAKKGEKVVCLIQGVQMNNGIPVLRGTIECLV